MSDTQKVDPFDTTGLVDPAGLLNDVGVVVKPLSTSDEKTDNKTEPELHTVEEPSN